MRYLAKLRQHPEYGEQLTVVFGTDDPAQISEDDARLFWKYLRREDARTELRSCAVCTDSTIGTDPAGLAEAFRQLNGENRKIISDLLAALLSAPPGTPADRA